jgi:N6-adenosine-specific RNA methylase IME4
MLAEQPFMFPPAAMPGWYWKDLRPHAYDLIMIDPPWHFSLYSDKGEAKSAQAQYRCMPLDEIAAMPVRMLAKPDCLVCCWATAPMLPDQIKVMAAWGFEYKSCGVWVKTTVHGKIGFGTGYGLRNAHELFLIGTVGNPTVTHGVRSVVMGLNRGHSQKPEEAYAAMEQLMPNATRADVFARRRRVGWDGFGDELGKLDEVTA